MITANNYQQNKPSRATLTPVEQEAYDFIEEGALDYYHEDASIRETLDLYFAELNKKQPKAATPSPTKPARKTSSGSKAPARKATKPAGPASGPTPKEMEHAIQVIGQTRIAELLRMPVAKVRQFAEGFAKHPDMRDSDEATAYSTVLKARLAADGTTAEYSEVKEVPTSPSILPEKARPAKKKAAKVDDGPVRTKVNKHGNQNTRLPVSHYTTDVAICQRVIALTKKEGANITRKQIKLLHQAIEKAIVERRVRKSDPHAKLFSDMATAVSAVLKAMTDGRIETVDVINFRDKTLIERARAVADAVQVRNSVGLLKKFINLQGTTPEVKTVQTLLAAMEKEMSDHPADANSSSIRAAVAVLKDWKHGMPLKITTQQLSGLNGLLGLGCPSTPAGADCGCSKKAGH